MVNFAPAIRIHDVASFMPQVFERVDSLEVSGADTNLDCFPNTGDTNNCYHSLTILTNCHNDCADPNQHSSS